MNFIKRFFNQLFCDHCYEYKQNIMKHFMRLIFLVMGVIIHGQKNMKFMNV